MTPSLSWLRIGGLATLTLAACGADDAASPPVEEAAAPPPVSPPPSSGTCNPEPCVVDPPPPASPDPLKVRFLGVAGFLVSRGDEAILTAPLFTRPSMVRVSTGLAVESDRSLVAKKLPLGVLEPVRAVISGHAHYDHLLDVPPVMTNAPNATFYSNVSARNLLAAYAPDRAPKCAGTPAQASTIARARVVAMDDPAASVVDYQGCPSQRPPGAPHEGKWVKVPGSHVRVLALCSTHPDQVGPIHFGPGDVTDEECVPPTNMNTWKEGQTLAFLIDFLDPKTDAPRYRVYYQDAPTDDPVGHVPASLLADKRIDVALLCVGSYNNVPGAPTGTITTLRPRYALGGHWEDFFRSADEPIQAIPFVDVSDWQAKARAALPPSAEARPLLVNGEGRSERGFVPQPDDVFEVAP